MFLACFFVDLLDYEIISVSMKLLQQEIHAALITFPYHDHCVQVCVAEVCCNTLVIVH